MRRRFRRGIELTERQFADQPWVYGALQLDSGMLYLKDGPVHGKPEPYGILYRPMLRAVFSDTISFSGIELDGKVWCAQVWYCMCYDTNLPVGAVKRADGTVQMPTG